jgi:hypothetical protein
MITGSPIASAHAALVREVLAVVDEATGTWATYARAWLDGSLVSGALLDPLYGRPATVRDFVRDAQAGATCAAVADKGYERARGLEDIAWAAEFLFLEKPEKARAFVISACRRLQVPFDRIAP